MKNNINFFALGILTLTLTLASCNNEVELPTTTTEPSKKIEGILSFKSQAEFDSTLQKVNAMSEEQRKEWEKSKGFKSFGTQCDEFYETIDFESIKSIDQLKALDVNNLLNIYTYEGETIIEPKEYNSEEKFLMNTNKMFIVSNMVFKIVDSKRAATNISQIHVLQEISTYNDFLSHPMLSENLQLNSSLKAKQKEEKPYEKYNSNKNYMIKVVCETENFFASFPTRTQVEVEFTITNYAKALIGYKLDTRNISFEVDLEAYDESGRLPEKRWANYGQSNAQQIRSYNKTEKFDIISGWSNSYITPKFSRLKGYINHPFIERFEL